MPYAIKKRGNKYAVVNTRTGRTKSAKFTTKTAAKAYMKALYAVEYKRKKRK